MVAPQGSSPQPLPLTPPAQTPTSKLAIWAIVLAGLGLCCFPLGLVGAVLGVVALVKIGENPALGGKGLAIASIALIAVSLMVNGILAALAIPAFVGYVRRSKTVEATKYLGDIYGKLDTRYRQQPNLPSIALTPSAIPCGKPHVWSVEELERFAPIGFAPDGPTNFSYEVVVNPSDVENAAAVIRAHGDLDCDGKTSLFEISVSPDGSGGLERARGFYIQNEIE